jgi:hypothetical protein
VALRTGEAWRFIAEHVLAISTASAAQLLVRSTRKVKLTDVGIQYFGTCRCLLVDLAEAERVAYGEYFTPKGGLTVSAPRGETGDWIRVGIVAHNFPAAEDVADGQSNRVSSIYFGVRSASRLALTASSTAWLSRSK